MAFANFSLTTAYTAIITALNAQLTAVGKLFTDQTTGDFVGQVRVSSTGKRLESWNGSAWVALDLSSTVITTATNATNATTAGNATTHIADAAGGVHGAVSTNTANMLVRRDVSGNFSAGTITASLSGNVSGSSGSCTGNSNTATTLVTARTINGVSFNGSTSITITAAANDVYAWAKAVSKPSYNYSEVGAPSTTGTNASGSWGISVTGSSASCTGNAASASTCTGNAENVTTPVDGYKHIGAWGVGRTDAGAILVNTAYCADYATSAGTAGSCTGNAASATTAASCTGNAATAGTDRSHPSIRSHI